RGKAPEPSWLQKPRVVDDEGEVAGGEVGGPPREHHARKEDLEVLHDRRHLGVDGELERDELFLAADLDLRGRDRVVHSVVDVERGGLRVTYAAPVHVALVGDDHRGGHGTHREPTLVLLVIRDGAHHRGHLFEREAQVEQDVLREQGPGLRVLLARHDVAHVVEVGSDRGDLAAACIVAKRLQDEASAVGRGVRVALAVLGVADRAGLLVGGADEDLYALVALHHLERGSLALRLDRRARLRLGAVDLLLFVRRVGVIGAGTRCLNGVCHGETLIRRAYASGWSNQIRSPSRKSTRQPAASPRY